MNELCEYGCGQIALYQLKNGKWCCSKSQNSCPENRRKIKESKKYIPIQTTELCSYGCGQIAKYKLKNGNYCCNEIVSQCPIKRKKNIENQKGKLKTKAIPIETTELCNYGCGQIAKYKFKSGKLCCSDHINKCPISRKKTIEGKKQSQFKQLNYVIMDVVK